MDHSSELLEIYNEDGTPSGKYKERKQVHRDGDLHKCVQVCLISHKNEILIQKRAPHKEIYPDKWDISVAGHVACCQSVMEAALKEIKEELGIEMSEKNLYYLCTSRQMYRSSDGVLKDNQIVETYIVHISHMLDINDFYPNPQEISQIRFIAAPVLQENIRRGDTSFIPHPTEYQYLFEYLGSL